MRQVLNAFALFTLMGVAILGELALIAMMMDEGSPIIAKAAFPILLLAAGILHFRSP